VNELGLQTAEDKGKVAVADRLSGTIALVAFFWWEYVKTN
jgi:hypothetical protein